MNINTFKTLIIDWVATADIIRLRNVLNRLSTILVIAALLLPAPLSNILLVTAILLALIHLYINYRYKQ